MTHSPSRDGTARSSSAGCDRRKRGSRQTPASEQPKCPIAQQSRREARVEKLRITDARGPAPATGETLGFVLEAASSHSAGEYLQRKASAGDARSGLPLTVSGSHGVAAADGTSAFPARMATGGRLLRRPPAAAPGTPSALGIAHQQARIGPAADECFAWRDVAELTMPMATKHSSGSSPISAAAHDRFRPIVSAPTGAGTGLDRPRFGARMPGRFRFRPDRSARLACGFACLRTRWLRRPGADYARREAATNTMSRRRFSVGGVGAAGGQRCGHPRHRARASGARDASGGAGSKPRPPR
jgi:hypothetical protein